MPFAGCSLLGGEPLTLGHGKEKGVGIVRLKSNMTTGPCPIRNACEREGLTGTGAWGRGVRLILHPSRVRCGVRFLCLRFLDDVRKAFCRQEADGAAVDWKLLAIEQNRRWLPTGIVILD